MKKRIAAEWEPALGVLVAWPICVPIELVQAIDRDSRLFLMCADEAGIEDARQTMPKVGIDPDGVTYLTVPKGDDEFWVRDWGPHPRFDEMGNYAMLGPRYRLATPVCGTEENPELYCTPYDDQVVPLSQYDGDSTDDLAPAHIARQLGIPFVKAPFAFTGGNVLSDGINTLISTKILELENVFQGFDVDTYYRYVADVTGMTNYTVLPNYEEFSINHIDCFLKILDERRLLVMRPPAECPEHDIYERIVSDIIPKTLNSYGEPWEIIRMDTGVPRTGEGLADYVNSLILNKSVYVPQYGIEADARALEIWREAMPGYNVQGFTFEFSEQPYSINKWDMYDECGWVGGDVLHCRTRAVWDPQMLHIDVPGTVGIPRAGKETCIDARIVAYSGEELDSDGCAVYWREAGASEFNKAPLAPSATREHYVAGIPALAAGTTVEYYVSAADRSGRAEVSPKGAPQMLLSFTVA